MKRALFLIFTIFLMAGTQMELKAQNKEKILIVYYSKTGTTRTVAEYIHQIVGGDIFEIIPAKSYPVDYQSTTDIAKQEQKENARPKIASNVKNISEYNTIFIGFPIWWGTMPMFFFTFLESHNLAGKTIIPFCTHGGGGQGQSISDIQKLCPKSTVKEALALRGTNNNSKESVAAWLRGLGLAKSTTPP